MRRRGGAVIYLLGAIFAIVAVFPFAWMLLSSIKTLPELYTVPPGVVAESADFAELREGPVQLQYPAILHQQHDHHGRIDDPRARSGGSRRIWVRAVPLPGQRIFQASILVGQLLPTATIIVPLYIVLGHLHLVNTYLGLILVYLILTLPLSVWMLIGYFRAIPFELDEAAVIDGRRG